MVKPYTIHTKIFLDGGIPSETKEAIARLGFLDGQTTNPSLITKHPSFIACGERGEACREADAWRYYREIVREISPLVLTGSVSIEVYADHTTKAEEMIEKGRELRTWIPNAHIKLPITTAGLAAAKTLVGEGTRVNMTLCFSQEQAAAVYAATRGATRGTVFLSPFVGRLDDRGEDGMSLVENILRMFREGDGHVETLVASVRNLDHFRRSLQVGADIITAPYKILDAWAAEACEVPGKDYRYPTGGRAPISYKAFDLGSDWDSFDITHELTDAGIERFASDWNALVQRKTS